MIFEKSNELYNIKRILGCVCKPIIKDIIAYDESTVCVCVCACACACACACVCVWKKSIVCIMNLDYIF